MELGIKLKICGMVYPANIIEVAALRPDYMGFIFFNGSPRFVGRDFVIPDTFGHDIKRVGVFVNATTEDMVRLAATHRLDYLQLHGNELPEQCDHLKQAGLGVIKAFPISSTFDFSDVENYEKVSDYFLFDTAGKQYGGTGNRFDWQVLSKYSQRVPFFLSGGITPDNVLEWKSLSTMNIHALDINSGVEDKPGMKSITSIDRLINNLKQNI